MKNNPIIKVLVIVGVIAIAGAGILSYVSMSQIKQYENTLQFPVPTETDGQNVYSMPIRGVLIQTNTPKKQDKFNNTSAQVADNFSIILESWNSEYLAAEVTKQLNMYSSKYNIDVKPFTAVENGSKQFYAMLIFELKNKE